MKKNYIIFALFLLLNISFLYSQNDPIIWQKPLAHIGVVNTAIFSPDESIIVHGAGQYVQSRDTTGEIINNYDDKKDNTERSNHQQGIPCP